MPARAQAASPSRLRRFPLVLAVVLTTLALAATGSLAAGEVGIPLREADAPERVEGLVDLETATIPELNALLDSGRLSSVQLTQLYLERIAAYDEGGPHLNSILSLDPDALDVARDLDRERRRSGPRGPLHGIPVLLKDNIDTGDLPTTAGSVIWAGSVPPDDATITARLREAGAIILGKTTLSEYANFLTSGMPNGYSSWGGQGLNPYDLDAGTSGSSSGSAVAAAASMAAAVIGTETSGSILSPSRANSVTALKPTLGLVSRDGIVPIAESQDTAGPMVRNVTDLAITLGALTGVDPKDPRTAESAGEFSTDYTQFLDDEALAGARIGYVTNYDNLNDDEEEVLGAAIAELEAQGATVVEVEVNAQNHPNVLFYEFKRDMNAYLAERGGPVGSLAELIAVNEANAREAIKYGQSLFLAAEAIDLEAQRESYEQNLANGKAATQGAIDDTLAANDLDALVFPQQSPAGLAARAGYPSLIVPVGYLADDGWEPAGMTFVGTAWSEPELLGFAYDYEQAADVWLPPSSVNPSAFRCPGPTDVAEAARKVLGACPS